MDAVDRKIINHLQGGLPVCERPYAMVAQALGLDEQTLIDRLEGMLDDGILSRFGPLYHAERLGGGLTLAAMAVPDADFERVAAIVNALPQVAHNYQREHEFNMWFVLATETPDEIKHTISEIERLTGLPVFNMPKQQEFYVGLKLDA